MAGIVRQRRTLLSDRNKRNNGGRCGGVSGCCFGRSVLLSIISIAFVVHILTVTHFVRHHDDNAATTRFLDKDSSETDDSADGDSTDGAIVALEVLPSSSDQYTSSSSQHISQLPIWIQDYVKWHKEMRKQFPGSKLFNDPNAPKLLIRTCLGLCGGLNDRLGQLPWDLYLANQTKRVLLLHWHRPVPLQHFLIPNELDWTVPKDINGFYPSPNQRVVSRKGMKIVRAHKELFENLGDETGPNTDFWNKHVDTAIQRANTGDFKDIKILRHRLLGHLNEDQLEQRLRKLGETDMIHWTKSFGHIFWMFFLPSPGVQHVLDGVYKNLNIAPQQYSGVHCRVRHPKSVPKGFDMKGKQEDYTADKTGLPWEGSTRQFAIQVATRALQCAKFYFEEDEPLYFFSDSNDLVRYIAVELQDEGFVKGNASLFKESSTDAAALEAVQGTRIVARDMSVENAHIDKQKGRDPPEYYTTFVDLLLAANARCLSYGVGFYAVFAGKISGTTCKVLYQEEQWGGSESKKDTAQECFLPSDETV